MLSTGAFKSNSTWFVSISGEHQKRGEKYSRSHKKTTTEESYKTSEIGGQTQVIGQNIDKLDTKLTPNLCVVHIHRYGGVKKTNIVYRQWLTSSAQVSP